MKTVTIGNHAFSKVICGANPFYGHSHFSEARDTEYLSRFDDAMIERTVQRCVDLGVNTLESAANERIVAILSRLREKNAGTLHFVGSTRLDETSKMKSHQQKLAYLIENRAEVCVIHAQYVDRPRRGAAIGGLERFVDKIHAAGLLAGISTHQVDTVELCEQREYGIDVYLFPLNLSGFVYPGYAGSETVQERVDLVRGVPKPFILIKTLGAGRFPPAEGLQFIAENTKPNDLVSIGFGSEDEASETIELAEKLL